MTQEPLPEILNTKAEQNPFTKGVTKAELEGLVDESGLQSVLESLAEICFEKAEHLRSNWQDRSSAKLWTKAGEFLSACAERKSIREVSP